MIGMEGNISRETRTVQNDWRTEKRIILFTARILKEATEDLCEFVWFCDHLITVRSYDYNRNSVMSSDV